jgi:hypothetical protein
MYSLKDMFNLAKLDSRHFKVKFEPNLVHITNLVNSSNQTNFTKFTNFTDFTQVKSGYTNFQVFNLISHIKYMLTHKIVRF